MVPAVKCRGEQNDWQSDVESSQEEEKEVPFIEDLVQQQWNPRNGRAVSHEKTDSNQEGQDLHVTRPPAPPLRAMRNLVPIVEPNQEKTGLN